MLAALVRTVLADIGAERTDFFSMNTATGHRPSRQRAERGAVDVGGDAGRHHLDIFFKQTGGCAMVAGRRTGVAGAYARLVKLERHRMLLSG